MSDPSCTKLVLVPVSNKYLAWSISVIRELISNSILNCIKMSYGNGLIRSRLSIFFYYYWIILKWQSWQVILILQISWLETYWMSQYIQVFKINKISPSVCVDSICWFVIILTHNVMISKKVTSNHIDRNKNKDTDNVFYCSHIYPYYEEDKNSHEKYSTWIVKQNSLNMPLIIKINKKTLL